MKTYLGVVDTNGKIFRDVTDSNGLPIKQLAFNGTTYDVVQGNTQGTLLASAARTTTATSPTQTNYNGRGVIIYLNVTANPGGAETMNMIIRHIDPVSGVSTPSVLGFVIPAATNAMYRSFIYPGASFSDTNNKSVNVPLSRLWSVSVLPSGAGSWTYSLGYDLIL